MELDAKVIAVGETEGIRFAFDKMERTPNTVDSHRLIWLADQHGCQDAVVEAVFRAYFSEGQDIGSRQKLINVVAEAGLDRAFTDHAPAPTSLAGSVHPLGVLAYKASQEKQRCST